MDDHKNEPKLHLLLVSFDAQGLINPLLELATRLVEKGLLVTFATTEIAGEKIRQSTDSTTTTNPLLQFRYFSDGWDLAAERNSTNAYFPQLNKVGPQTLTQLIHELASQNSCVSCIISNPFQPWVLEVAEAQQIPCALLWTQPYHVYAIYNLYLRGLDRLPISSQPGSLHGFPALGFEDLPSYLFPPYRSTPLIAVLSETFEKIDRFKWVLVNSYMDLEKEVSESFVDSPPVIFIGPLVPTSLLEDNKVRWNVRGDMRKPCPDCIAWLDAQQPSSVVYVSFGSWVVQSQEQMEELAWGLKQCGRPFLWVITDWSPPKEFLEETAGVGKVVRWCSQVDVLSHISVACFLSHCGWNSTLESISAGVPVIAFPNRGDQLTNAKLLVDVYGMGVRLISDEGGIVGREEAKRCIDDVIEGPKAQELKMSALRWRKTARDARKECGSSAMNIDSFIDDINAWRCQQQSPGDGLMRDRGFLLFFLLSILLLLVIEFSPSSIVAPSVKLKSNAKRRWHRSRGTACRLKSSKR